MANIIKSVSGTVLLFEDDELIVFKSQSITKPQRLFIAISGILIAVAGIILNIKGESTFSLYAFLVMLATWCTYFIYYLVSGDNPKQIRYKDVKKIVISNNRSCKKVSIFLSNRTSPVKFRAKEVDENLVEFLRTKNLTLK